MTAQSNPATTGGGSRPSSNRWPALPVAEWAATRDTLQLWAQIVGKVRIVNEPTVNHWWNVPLYVTAQGLTTSLISHPSGQGFQIDFDLRAQQLVIVNTAGSRRTLALQSGPVADFYAEVMGLLDELGVTTHIWPVSGGDRRSHPLPERPGAHRVRA